MDEIPRRHLPLIVVGLGGTGLIYLAARTGTPNALELTRSAIELATLTTFGPIISAGLLVLGVIIAACVIPLVVILALTRKDKDEDR